MSVNSRMHTCAFKDKHAHTQGMKYVETQVHTHLTHHLRLDTRHCTTANQTLKTRLRRTENTTLCQIQHICGHTLQIHRYMTHTHPKAMAKSSYSNVQSKSINESIYFSAGL